MIERVAFVSHPRSSAYMGELLGVVGDAVARAGMPVLHHTGTLEDVDDGVTAFVVVPHEYVAVAGPVPEDLRARTVALCVEHPGTETFEASVRAAGPLAARFDINADGTERMRERGLSCERFVLGYSSRWDRRSDVPMRDVDIVYLGTADPRRLGLLAQIMPQLSHRTTELLLPPHEPMTRPRPDFVMAEAKWRLLARSRVLVNLHREAAIAFEWVRALEAICNGTVVVTEPSTDLWPLVPGEDVIAAEPDRMAWVIEALLADEALRASIADRALTKARDLLDMNDSATRLAECAAALPSGPRRVPAAPRPELVPAAGDGPLAVWVPTVPAPDVAQPSGVIGTVHARPVTGPPPWLDVLCVSAREDGPVWETLHHLPATGIAVHVALDGTRAPGIWSHAAVTTVLTNDAPAGRGASRAALLAHAGAPWVLVLDSGDVVGADTLARLRALMTADRDLVYPMATVATPPMIVNALIPEARRLERYDYLSRGYLVRRAWLDEIGGFDTSLDSDCDHDFWLRSARASARTELVREVGSALWPKRAAHGPAQV